MTSSWLNRVTMTSARGAAKKTLNSSGDVEHPCRRPCVTGNQSDSYPSSVSSCKLRDIYKEKIWGAESEVRCPWWGAMNRLTVGRGRASVW